MLCLLGMGLLMVCFCAEDISGEGGTDLRMVEEMMNVFFGNTNFFRLKNDDCLW